MSRAICEQNGKFLITPEESQGVQFFLPFFGRCNTVNISFTFPPGFFQREFSDLCYPVPVGNAKERM
jgi:hypothetical protein